jgi:transposase InsO family protein
MKDLEPKDHGEAVALFRHSVIGRLVHRALARGELHQELVKLSSEHFRPPESDVTKTFAVSTLERWYYDGRSHGLAGLVPATRAKGHALEVPGAAKALLLAIRREHRSASAALIRRTLVEEGELDPKVVSEPTLRRFYNDHGLTRIPMRDGQGPKTRLRWEAERPGVLWQGDVCHGSPIVVGGTTRPVRIHALLDDASRYVVALQAMHTERELDMLVLLVEAFRRHGLPGTIYLDNGSTYRGETLRVACARLGVALLHPKPYDPEARGKIERFFRTLREGCLDHLGAVASLHDINVRLSAWLDRHYHKAPHAGLMGRSPGKLWREAMDSKPADELDEKKLREALTVRERRRVRRDTTLSIEGQDFELDQGFLAGAMVQVAYCPIDQPLAPWVEHQGKRYELRLVDAKANATRKRPARRPWPREDAPPKSVAFDPAKTLLDRALGKKPTGLQKPKKETDR